MCAAHLRLDVLGPVTQSLSVGAYDAAIGIVDASQTLARSRRARHDHQLTGRNGDGNTLQRQCLRVARPEEAIERGRLHRRAAVAWPGCERGGHGDQANESVILRHGSTLSAPTGPASVSVTVWPLRKNS